MIFLYIITYPCKHLFPSSKRLPGIIYIRARFVLVLMDVSVQEDSKLHVSFTEKSVVKAIKPLPKPITLSLSNLDLLSGRFPVTYIYFYQNPDNFSLPFIVKSLKNSLAETLGHYYPFAGRIIQTPETGEPEIICDNSGALIVEGHANISLKEYDFYNIGRSLQGKLVNIDPDFPLQVQVTSYTCGGISITFTLDRALGDASSFGKFLLSWSEIANKKPISCIPNHQRNLHARNPPIYHSSLDQTFIKCTMEDIINMPATNIQLKRLYHIDISSINQLHQLAWFDAVEDCVRTWRSSPCSVIGKVVSSC